MAKYIIKNANFIDGNGGEMKTNMSILVEDKMIVKIAEGEIDAPDAEVIDATGKYVLPGLIDCHVHYGGVYESSDKDWVCENDFDQCIRSVDQCQQSLKHGFTTVRDISRNGIHLRNMIDQDFIFGPRILPSGRGLTRTGGHADSNFFPQDFVKEHHPWGVIADGPEEVRKAVRGVLREGAQFIKLWASGGGINDYEKETDTHFTEEEIAMMVSEAREFGKKVAAHCENKDSIIKCLKAGVDSIEHGEEFDEEVVAWVRENMTQEELDKVTLVPTIGLYVDWYEQFDPPKERDLTGCVGDTLGQKEIDRIHKSFTRAFKDLGIRVAVGADSFCTKLNPYGMYTHNEMYALVAAGMTNSEVIVAATKNGAICLGIEDETGTLEENKLADILILNANPLENIRNVCHENIALIMKQGDIVDFNKMPAKDMATINAKRERDGKPPIK